MQARRQARRQRDAQRRRRRRRRRTLERCRRGVVHSIGAEELVLSIAAARAGSINSAEGLELAHTHGTQRPLQVEVVVVVAVAVVVVAVVILAAVMGSPVIIIGAPTADRHAQLPAGTSQAPVVITVITITSQCRQRLSKALAHRRGGLE
jgi:hypothetical protein